MKIHELSKEDRIAKYTELFNNEATRYLFLVQLNPPAGFKEIEQYKASLEVFQFIKENIKEFEMSGKLKKEILRYVKKGITLMYRGIHDLES